jgi:hypothetical protein
MIPNGDVRFGFPKIDDNVEIADLIACGAHAILFSTGRSSVIGSAISPVIKVCANPEMYSRMEVDSPALRSLHPGTWAARNCIRPRSAPTTGMLKGFRHLFLIRPGPLSPGFFA